MSLPRTGMIFCAGFGRRMGPLAKDRPKPMVTLGGETMVSRAARLLRSAGIARLVANTHHLRPVIEPHLEDLGVAISREEGRILDTGGGLKAARPLLGDGPVVTLNPDIAWQGENPVETLLSAWRDDMDALLLLVPAERTLRDRPADFRFEAGSIPGRPGDYVYTGAQIIRPELTDAIDEDVFSLNLLWNRLIAEGRLSATLYPGEWRDIGTPEGLAEAEATLAGAGA